MRAQSVPASKVQQVENLKVLASKKVVAVVNFTNVPANLMQKIRRELKGSAELKVAKNTLIERALRGTKHEKLADYLSGQCALIVSEENPFKLFKHLGSLSIDAALKPNQTSPIDVEIPEGPTSLPPGPVVAELQMAGIPAAVEKGKVTIKKRTLVVKAGEAVKSEVAKALEKLNIKPLKIGLQVLAVSDEGVILTPETLTLDTEKVLEDFTRAYQMALNLAVNCCYVTKETASILLTKAYMDARSLAINAGIFEKEVMPDILAKAYNEMLALVSLLPAEALDEELQNLVKGVSIEVKEKKLEKEEEKEEKKKEEEEKKEEEAIEGLAALFG